MLSRFVNGAAVLLLLLLTSHSDATYLQNRLVNSTNTTINATAVGQGHRPLPTVDLGYALYEPTAVNTSGQYYNFSNIRYAAPPLGDLRWRAPRDPLTDRTTISNGSLGFTCLQSSPEWFTQANTALGNLLAVIPPSVSGQSQSEDCLFLDVIAPIKHFRYASRSAAVVVNIHGGGFWQGDKMALYPPNGLLESANNDFVYVSMNYRLAALGFLTGLPDSEANQTTPNAGLLDQRFALKWAQKYIHLFGGDPGNVTIMGESAGGASVQYHTIAYGGAKEANLFIRGISQSPAPLASDPIYATIGANLLLENLGVNNIEEARQVSTDALQKANMNAQKATPFNVVYFGPVVDNDLILDIIPRSYSKGLYVKNISLVVADNQNEARFLGNQSINSNADFDNWVYLIFPSAGVYVQNRIITTIYPADYSGKQPYTTPQQRSDLAVKEYQISCNLVSSAKAYGNQTYNYIFGIPPAIHAQDLAYTYTPHAATAVFYPQIAAALREYLANFILTGNPNKNGLSTWDRYGIDAKAMNFTAQGVQEMTLDAANRRCNFWNKASYYPRVLQNSLR